VFHVAAHISVEVAEAILDHLTKSNAQVIGTEPSANKSHVQLHPLTIKSQ